MQREIKELMKSSVCIPHFEKFDCEREKIIEAVNGGILKDTVKYVCMPVRAIQESGHWWFRVEGRTKGTRCGKERDEIAPRAHQKLAREVSAEAGWHVGLVAARWKVLACLGAYIFLRKSKPRSSPTAWEIRWDLGSKASVYLTAFCEFWHSESLHYIFIFLFCFCLCSFVLNLCNQGRVSKGYSGVFVPDR